MIQDDFDEFDEEDLLVAENASHKRVAEDSDRRAQSDEKRQKYNEEGPALSIPRRILKEVWGFPDFRLKQALAVSSLLAGRNSLVVFPTGGGKSLVYQIPALAFDEYDSALGQPQGGGVTLVVSPLIALMKVGL